MFSEVSATVRSGGVLLGLFPSWDATEYAMQLASRSGQELPGLGSLDAAGVYAHDGLRQKFWKPEEIERRCEAAGLTIESLEKICFPWSAMADAGWGDFEGEAEMWDWYLRARRS
jgi:hypothetical protein